ncbi:MAG: hypothetical protein QXD03_02540 [Candidatus Anstonellales archaeon]
MYIVGKEIQGYSVVGVNEIGGLSGKDIVIVVKEKVNVAEYYVGIRQAIRNGNRVKLVVVKEFKDNLKAILYMMATHGIYDIYIVDNEGLIDRDYIDKVIKRKATVVELQEFVSGDISAYAELSTILMGIEKMIKDRNIEGLMDFVRLNVNSIENLICVIEYMKHVVDNYEVYNLEGKVSELEKTVKELSNDITNKEATINVLENKVKELKEVIKSKDTEIEELKSNGSRVSVIKSYSEINTALIKCKVKIVLYFKEITPVPYTNSLIDALVQYISLKNLKVKLLVYDDKSSLACIYKPLNIVDSTEYMNKREAYINEVNRFVVSEPNPVILSDILTATNAVDVLVIYDRMYQIKDLVVGNNVKKFFIINSSNDFKVVQNLFRINDKSYVITRENSTIDGDVLDIPKIEDYDGLTSSARLSKYTKVVTTKSKKPLIKTILEKSMIDTLITN